MSNSCNNYNEDNNYFVINNDIKNSKINIPNANISIHKNNNINVLLAAKSINNYNTNNVISEKEKELLELLVFVLHEEKEKIKFVAFDEKKQFNSTLTSNELHINIIKEFKDEKNKDKEYNQEALNNEKYYKDILNTEKIKFLNLIYNYLETNKSDTKLITSQIIMKKLFELFESNMFKDYKYIVYDYDKNTIEKLNVLFDEVILIEESNYNFKVKNILWEELCIIYKIFVCILNSISALAITSKNNNYILSLNRYLNKVFLRNLLFNLNTFDSDERLLIKLIIYKIYSVNIDNRHTLLHLLEEYLIDFIATNENTDIVVKENIYFENNNNNYDAILNKNHYYNNIQYYNKLHYLGIINVLDILKSIYLGLNKPILSKYVNLFNKRILNIFKHKQIKSFWNNLKTFIIDLINFDKDSFLNNLIVFMYKSWPNKNPDKICYLIELIEAIFINMNEDNNKKDNKNILFNCIYFVKLSNKIINSITNLNVVVADKTLILFKHDELLNFFIDDCKLINVLLTKLIENIKNHWSDEIKSISKLVLSKIKNNKPECLSQCNEEVIKYINSIQFSQDNEYLWDLIKYELKAD